MALIVAGSPPWFPLTAAFLGGVTLVQGCGELPPLWAGPLACLFLWLAWRFACLRRYLAILICLCLGATWATIRAELLLNRALPESWEGRDMVVTGTVVSLPQRAERYLKFDLDVENSSTADTLPVWRGRTRLRWYRPYPPLKPGQRWQFPVRLKRPHGFQNPGGYDYERQLFRQGIGATGYVRGGRQARLLGSAASLHEARDRLRERLSQPLSRIAEPASVLLPGLILGDRGQMRTAHWETLRRTGTTHLMAISGLHVGLVAGMAFWVAATAWRATGRLMLWWPAPYAGATAALCAAAAYALMAGLSVATQRALIMLACVMVGLLWRRSLPPGRSLAVALWLILLLDPMTVLEPGFWLSFLGAGSILFALATAPGPRRWRLWLRVQLMLGLVLAPATLAYFGQVSLLSPLANLLAIPVVGVVVVPTALVASLVLVWGDPWGAGSLLLELAAWVLNHLWPILEWLAGRGFAAWSAPRPSWWAVLGATCAMLWWWLPLPAGIRSLAVIWLLPVLIKAPDNPADGAFRATFLDVGQGLAVVVETRSHVLLYDTGPRYSEQFDAGTAVVVPFLHARGITSLDALVISHGDNDHIGGLTAVREAVAVDRALSSVPQRVAGASACRAGQAWEWDEVRFLVLHPTHEVPAPGNNASCVLKISGRHGRLLLTADIESAVETELLRRSPSRLDTDVLLVPHQGSATSSTPGFLAATAPRLAVVASGYRNPYGHPAEGVLRRYRERSVPVVNTAKAGAVTVEFGAEGIRWHAHRERHRRYWFHDIAGRHER
jgi:competence protein ComEC